MVLIRIAMTLTFYIENPLRFFEVLLSLRWKFNVIAEILIQ